MESSSGQHGSSIRASLSGRYASALFDLAAESRSIDAVEASLDTLGRALTESDDLRRLTTSPLTDRKDAGRAMAATAQAMQLDETTTRFLGVLAENRRLNQLPAIVRAFRTLASSYRGETRAEVTSAHPLDAEQVDQLKHQLRQRIGRDVSVDLTVDKSLLGGLVVRIGSQMIDSSIRTRLNSLAHAMKG